MLWVSHSTLLLLLCQTPACSGRTPAHERAGGRLGQSLGSFLILPSQHDPSVYCVRQGLPPSGTDRITQPCVTQVLQDLLGCWSLQEDVFYKPESGEREETFLFSLVVIPPTAATAKQGREPGSHEGTSSAGSPAPGLAWQSEESELVPEVPTQS